MPAARARPGRTLCLARRGSPITQDHYPPSCRGQQHASRWHARARANPGILLDEQMSTSMPTCAGNALRNTAAQRRTEKHFDLRQARPGRAMTRRRIGVMKAGGSAESEPRRRVRPSGSRFVARSSARHVIDGDARHASRRSVGPRARVAGGVRRAGNP